jgi:hypothetical protein
MALTSKAAMIIGILIVVPQITLIPAASAERMTTISQEAFICINWAAWHEYGLASLTARGARMSKACPLRLAAKTKVAVVNEDAGHGASEIRYLDKIWFIDNQRLK